MRFWTFGRLLLAFATVVVLPFIALIAYNAVDRHQTALAQARAQLEIVADEAAERLALRLKDSAALLARLAERPGVRALDPGDCDPFLPEFDAAHHEFTTLTIRDLAGNAVCSTLPANISPEQLKSLPWYHEAVSGTGLTVSDAHLGTNTRRWVSVLTYPVRDSRNAIGGRMVMPLDLEQLQQRVFGTVPEHVVLAVLDRKNRILMRSAEREQWVGKPAVQPELIEAARREGRGFARVPGADGVERVYALRLVPETGWVVAAGLPAAVALAGQQARLSRDAALALAAMLLSLALAWILSRLIAGPVRHLAQAVRKAAQNPEERAHPGGPTEIEAVAREFNRMLDALQTHEARLKASEARYRGIVGTAMDAIVTIDASQRIVQFNPAAEEMFRLPASSALGESIERFIPERARAAHAGHVRRFAESGVTTRRMGALLSLTALRADGSEFPIEASISQATAAGERHFTAVVRDVSERLAAERRIARLLDFYTALSRTNRTLLLVREPQALFQEVCRICVEHGRAILAYVLLTENGRAIPAAWAGPGEEFLRDIAISLDASVPEGRGPAGRAIREGRRHIANDFLGDPDTRPWRERAMAIGTRASAAFPIRRAGRVVGALGLQVAEKDFFDAELIALLDEMAADISFSLDNIDRDGALRAAEHAARESGAKLRLAVSAADLYAWSWDIPSDRLEWERDPAPLLGPAGSAGHYPDFRELVHPEDRERYLAAGQDALAGGSAYEIEFRVRALDGKVRWIHARGVVERDARGSPERMRGVSMEVTQRKQAERDLAEAEARFRGLVEQSIAGIYILQDGVLQYVNPRFAEILGYAGADVLAGRDGIGFVAEADRARVAETMGRLARGELATATLDFDAVRGDGPVIRIGVHVNRATYRGRRALIGLMQDISEKKRAEDAIQHYVSQLQGAFMRTVEVATTLSELRDPYTAGHERRVAAIAVAIGEALGLEAQRLEGLRVAGYLHDIGKIAVPAEILAKPGRLSDVEMQLIQEHPRTGYDVLKGVGFPWPVAEATLQHHERLDGSGYPQGLAGEAIGLEARILAVADTVESMASHRPYRSAQGIDLALAEIERGRGSSYDPAVADACLKLFREKDFRIPD